MAATFCCSMKLLSRGPYEHTFGCADCQRRHEDIHKGLLSIVIHSQQCLTHIIEVGGGVQIANLFKDMDEFKSLVRSVAAPGLILNQESDAPRGQSPPELMAADMQDGEGYAIPMSAHQVHQDQPEVVNALLLKFLRTKVCHVQV